MDQHEKITIIEGPPPTFELVSDPGFLGLVEGPIPTQIAVCHLRTFNGPALVERCYRAWRDGQQISLEFRSDEGLTQEAPIIAARWAEMEEGQVLFLWVRLDDVEIEIELDFGEDDFEDDWNAWDDDDF